MKIYEIEKSITENNWKEQPGNCAVMLNNDIVFFLDDNIILAYGQSLMFNNEILNSGYMLIIDPSSILIPYDDPFKDDLYICTGSNNMIYLGDIFLWKDEFGINVYAGMFTPSLYEFMPADEAPTHSTLIPTSSPMPSLTSPTPVTTIEPKPTVNPVIAYSQYYPIPESYGEIYKASIMFIDLLKDLDITLTELQWSKYRGILSSNINTVRYFYQDGNYKNAITSYKEYMKPFKEIFEQAEPVYRKFTNFLDSAPSKITEQDKQNLIEYLEEANSILLKTLELDETFMVKFEYGFSSVN